MIVLGIDASTTNIGWALMDYQAESLVAHGTIHMDGTNVYLRITEGVTGTINNIRRHVPVISVCAIESSFFTKNPWTGKMISYCVGSIIYELMKWCVPFVKELPPKTIKEAFTLDGKADKEKIKEMVEMEFGFAPESEDEADAIAIASAYIRLNKQGYFKAKAAEKEEVRAKKAKARAAGKRVGKKSLSGELEL